MLLGSTALSLVRQSWSFIDPLAQRVRIQISPRIARIFDVLADEILELETLIVDAFGYPSFYLF